MIYTPPRLKENKIVCYDDITVKFLGSLKDLARNKKMSFYKIEEALNISTHYVSDIYRFITRPRLSLYIKLAEFFDYDVSESVNYKYFCNKINFARINTLYKYYGWSLKELAYYAHTSITQVHKILHKHKMLSLQVLHDVIQVLEREAARKCLR